MDFDFERILTFATLVVAFIIIIDCLLFSRKRRLKATQAYGSTNSTVKLPWLVEQARSFFPILLIVLAFRSFAFELFRIPTGSLKPTLIVGDMVVINKFAYGLRLPVLHTKLLDIGEPKIGDITVFHYPPKPSIYYIKRMIGVPGTRIDYTDKVLTINGQKAPQTFQKYSTDFVPNMAPWTVTQNQEDLLGIKHSIYLIPDAPAKNFIDLVVPAGQYFGMGDNRDNSLDSRSWGFIPEKNLVGKAVRIIFSWDSQNSRVRWERIGMKI